MFLSGEIQVNHSVVIVLIDKQEQSTRTFRTVHFYSIVKILAPFSIISLIGLEHLNDSVGQSPVDLVFVRNNYRNFPISRDSFTIC